MCRDAQPLTYSCSHNIMEGDTVRIAMEGEGELVPFSLFGDGHCQGL